MNIFGHRFESATVLLVDRFISFLRRMRSVAALTTDATKVDLTLGTHAETLI